MKKLSIASLMAAGAAVALAATPASAKTFEIGVSLETGPNHVRNKAMETWAQELEKKSNGQIKLVFYHGASKYSDANLPRALGQGAMDMGALGWWQLDKFVPEFGLQGLPMFYGATREQNYAVVDGEIGKEMNKKIEEKIGVKIIGRWFDLGHASTFSTKCPLATHADLAGQKVRIPGGSPNLNLYRTMGANPVIIRWPEVPQSLQTGVIDGVQTTHESVRSAKLWDAGLKCGFNDRQTFFQYVPMMSERTWKKIPKDLQKLIVDTWEASIDANRKTAADRQKGAQEEGAKQGIKTTEVPDAELKAMREKLLKTQDALVKELNMDPKFVERAKAVLDKTS